MSYPIPSTPETTVVDRTDYNSIQAVTENILGLNNLGYGLASANSVPVTGRNQITTSQWAVLLTDLNIIHRHVYDTTTSTAVPTTSTVITPALHNEINALAQSLNSVRYQIHENQYFVDPISGSSVINIDYESDTIQGVSTSTSSQWLGSITHIIRMGFATEEIADYFFNTGGKLVWNTTFDANTGETSSDTAWADFITDIMSTVNPPVSNLYEYDRTKYLAGNDSVTLQNTSATVQITVSVEKTQGRLFKFTAIYADLKPGALEIVPDGYTWRY